MKKLNDDTDQSGRRALLSHLRDESGHYPTLKHFSILGMQYILEASCSLVILR